MDSTDDVIVKPMWPRNLSAALNDIQQSEVFLAWERHASTRATL